MRRLRAILRSLPDTAAIRRTPGVAPWDETRELLTLLLEELSVLTSDHRRKKPLALPRPGRKAPPPPGTVGIMTMARAMAKAGRVRVVRGGDAAGAG